MHLHQHRKPLITQTKKEHSSHRSTVHDSRGRIFHSQGAPHTIHHNTSNSVSKSKQAQPPRVQKPCRPRFRPLYFHFLRLNLALDLNFADPFLAPLFNLRLGSNSVNLYLDIFQKSGIRFRGKGDEWGINFESFTARPFGTNRVFFAIHGGNMKYNLPFFVRKVELLPDI